MPHRILIADDDEIILEALKTYLGDVLGYQVNAVTSGNEALDTALEQSFDLAVLDIRMEGLSGSETYMRLKKLQPTIEAIFFTADQEFERTMDFLRFSLPAERVLTKPLDDFGVLTRLIINILGPPVP